MKKLKKILAVSTAVSVLSLSLSLPTDCVSAANSNNAVSYTVFSLKRGGTYKTKYTLNPVDTLSSTNARAVIGDDTRVVDFSKSGVVKINFTASNGESYWGTGFVVDEHTIATAAHCVCEQTNGKNATNSGSKVTEINFFNSDGTPGLSITDAVEVHVPTLYVNGSYSDYNPYDYALIKVNEDLSDYAIFNLGIMNDNFINKQTAVSVTGFPKKVNNQEVHNVMYTGTGFIRQSDDNELYYDIDTFGGNSGGPIYITSTFQGKAYYTVIGIHAYGDANSYNGGARITTNLLQFYKNNPYI